MPIILIGKNGSGKTNALEALATIVSANNKHYENVETGQPSYRAYIQLSEEDVATMLPDIVYDKNKCEIVAYNSNGNLEINRVSSEYVVPSMKEEITVIRDRALQLKKAVEIYKEQLFKIAHGGHRESPVNCYRLKDADGGLTTYYYIQLELEGFIKNIHEGLDQMLKAFDDDEQALTFIEENGHRFYFCRTHKPFRLEYVEPCLANFEKNFVSINRRAIKREITKINKATKDSCELIDKLIEEIEEKIGRIQDGLYNDYRLHQERKKDYFSLLQRVRNIIGRRCLFLKNESMIFRKEYRRYSYYNHHSNSIIETYLRHVYTGKDKEELLNNYPGKPLDLPEKEVAKFEEFLNKSIPKFEKGMYNSISVRKDENKAIVISLNEKTGEQIDLNETSAGRRWYFTYYFMKSILEEGDIFIIDEPAVMLHPSAQREVLSDLMELAKRGVKVVYSTHSPYLIPDEWQCVHFVTMTEDGTEVSGVSSNQELSSQIKEIGGGDIFDVQAMLEKYFLPSPEKIARNISDLIRVTKNKKGIKSLEKACDEIGIKYSTMKSWNCMPKKQSGEKNDKFSVPSLENRVKVLKWAKII